MALARAPTTPTFNHHFFQLTPSKYLILMVTSSNLVEVSDNLLPSLIISNELAHLYGIPSCGLDHCRIRVIDPNHLQLTNISLIAISSAHDPFFKPSLIDHLIRQSHELEVRDEYQDGSRRYLVIDTQPLRQGFITNHTEIHWIDSNTSLTNTYNQVLSRSNTLPLNQFFKKSKLKNMDPRLKRLVHPIWHSILEVEVLSTPISFLAGTSEMNREFDLEAGMTMATFKNLNITNGTWITLICQVGQQQIGQHLARLHILDPPSNFVPLYPSTKNEIKHWKNHTIYISPMMAHYINHSPLAKIHLSQISTHDQRILRHTSLIHHKGWDHESMPREGDEPSVWAKEIVLARISSPQSIQTRQVDVHLIDHFRSPKIVQEGDLVAVSCHNQSTYIDDSIQGDINPLPWPTVFPSQVIYFQVVQVQMDSIPKDGHRAIFSIVNHQTSIVQRSTITGPKPPRHESFWLSIDLMPPSARYRPWFITKFPPPGLEEEASQMARLVRLCLSPLSNKIQYHIALILSGAPGSGKTCLIQTLASYLGMHVVEQNCVELISHRSVTQTEDKIKQVFERASQYRPCLLVLDHIDWFDRVWRRDQEDSALSRSAGQEWSASRVIEACIKRYRQSASNQPLNEQSVEYGNPHAMVVIATTRHYDDLSIQLMSCFNHHIDLTKPDQPTRCQILKAFLQQVPVSLDIDTEEISRMTATFVLDDFRVLIEHTATITIERVKRLMMDSTHQDLHQLEMDWCCAGFNIGQDDIKKAIEIMHDIRSSSIRHHSTPNIPKVTWDDIGGLAYAKKEILDTIQLPLTYPQLFQSSGLHPRSGILLYGPPGTGKTLLAKAIATECQLHFISVKGPELINMYVGESEKNVRELFQRARDAHPCVIFFDELDSLAPNRGAHGDSGGVSDRIVSQLLTELSSINDKHQIFVIGATNRPDLIEPALLVPGRFDKTIFIGINSTPGQKLLVLKALSRKINFDQDVDLEKIAAQCPVNLTSADLYALCSGALKIAIKEQVIKMKSLAKAEIQKIKDRAAACCQNIVQVSQSHLDQALSNLKPSVSVQELERYQLLEQQWSEKRHPY